MDALPARLAAIEQYLQRAIAAQPKLTAEDIDAKEITAQLAEQIRLQQYRWADSKYLPHVLAVHVREDKADTVEPLELVFCTVELARLILEAAKTAGLESFMPMRAEVELVKKDYPALMAGSGRCAVTISWPKLEDSLALADIIVDHEQHRIVAIQVRRASMPLLARLTSLNAEVYRNNYLLIRDATHIGRLRVVIDDSSGRFVRRNDFIFAQNDDPQAICNSVSRQQAKIIYGADGSFYIEDNGSANQTQIERNSGGKREIIDAKPGMMVRLLHNDILHFGLAQVRFSIIDHIDPMVLAEIGSEQERVSLGRGERHQNVTMKLPAAKPDQK